MYCFKKDIKRCEDAAAVILERLERTCTAAELNDIHTLMRVSRLKGMAEEAWKHALFRRTQDD